MRKTPKRIGLAIVGAGRVGLFRGEVAARHPMVDFIGICDLKEDRLELVQAKTQADYATTDFRELLEAAGNHRGDHRHRRAPARRADPGGVSSASIRC